MQYKSNLWLSSRHGHTTNSEVSISSSYNKACNQSYVLFIHNLYVSITLDLLSSPQSRMLILCKHHIVKTSACFLHIYLFFLTIFYVFSISYIYMYNILNNNCFSALTSFLCDLTPWLGCLHAAVVLHAILLRNISRSPLSFFDTTPVGRILSRFSKDMESVDNSMPRYISDSIYCLFEVKGLLILLIVF